MNATAFILAAFPRHGAKHIAKALGCSDRQAWRIVSTGRVPGRFRATLLQVIDGAIENNEQRLKELRQELRLHEYAEQRRGEAAHHEANVVGPVSPMDSEDRRR